MQALGIGAGGIAAATAMHTAAARNVANVSAADAPRQRVDHSAAADRAGVVSQQRTVDPSSGSVTGDLVDLRTSAATYSANGAVIRAGDETLGALFDMYA